jgi:rare lipoprotein A
MVTNLQNGRSTEVTINDRGPFVKGRIIDLSHAAARTLGMIGPGTIPVKVEVIDSGSNKIVTIAEHLDYTLQVGSFAEIENALRLRERLSQSYPEVSQISIVSLHGKDTTYYRVQLGTFSSRDEAEGYAQQLARKGFPIIIMEK